MLDSHTPLRLAKLAGTSRVPPRHTPLRLAKLAGTSRVPPRQLSFTACGGCARPLLHLGYVLKRRNAFQLR